MASGETFLYKTEKNLKIISVEFEEDACPPNLCCLSDLGKCSCYESYYPSSCRIHTQTPVLLACRVGPTSCRPQAPSRVIRQEGREHRTNGLGLSAVLSFLLQWCLAFCGSSSRSDSFLGGLNMQFLMQKWLWGWWKGPTTGTEQSSCLLVLGFSHPGLGQCYWMPNLDLLF